MRRWLQDLAWPTYDCEDCVGAGREYGCYCAYYDAIAPGAPAPRSIRVLRWVLERTLFRWRLKYKREGKRSYE